MARAALSVFLRPWVRKFQVARSCVDWSAKDCICINGILYIVQRFGSSLFLHNALPRLGEQVLQDGPLSGKTQEVHDPQAQVL